MKKLFLLLILLISTLILFSCNKSTKPEPTTKITGNLQFYDLDNTIIDSFFTTKISLYYSEDFIDSLKTITKDYVNVFSSLETELLTDYRVFSAPLYEITTNNNSFEFNKIPKDDYILVYESENFGWHYQLINSSTKSLLLKMKRKLEINQGISEEPIEWGPNQYINISSDFYCYAPLEILENTVITFENNSKLFINSNLSCIGSSTQPILFTSNNKNPQTGDWGQIIIQETCEEATIKNAIMRWSNLGIINHGNLKLENFALCSNGKGVQNYYKNLIFTNSLSYNSNVAIELYDTDQYSIIPKIQNSLFINNSEKAILVQGSSPKILNNVFINNYMHIDLKTTGGHAHYGTEPSIMNCLFDTSERYKISINRASPTIKNNIFQNGDNAFILSVNASFDMENNNFENMNNNLVIKLSYRSGGSTVNAQNNWWDTTQEEKIQNLIYDENDEPGGDNIGYVEYSPWKTNEIYNAGPQ